MRNIPFGCPLMEKEEEKAVLSVLESHILTHGPRVKDFESAFSKFTKAEYCIATSSCTSALHLAYFYLGIGEGDEVIVPAQSHVATAHAVELCHAKPVFIDAENRTGNIDLKLIEESISNKTKAISVVHYLGMPVDMERVDKIAKKHGLFVVEDCALAIGTYFKGRHAGLFGDVGCFSFYPVKHITTAEGGMLTTGKKEIAEAVSMQRAFGIDRNIVSERKIPGMYDVQSLGFNYRMNEISAALGLEQMKRISGFLRKRRENYKRLSKGLSEIKGVTLFESSKGHFQSSYYCLAMLLEPPHNKKRFEIMSLLKEKGIGTSIYYPRPIPHMTYYARKYGYGEETFPIASRISTESISLPVGPHITPENVDYMILAVEEAIKEVSDGN